MPLNSAAGGLASVFVAQCSGAFRLSADIGRCVCLIQVTRDVGVSIASLNAAMHGCARRWPGSFQPLEVENGWDDWKVVGLLPERGAFVVGAPFGIAVGRRAIVVPLAPNLLLDEFATQLSAALRPYRLQEVTIAPGFLEARCARFAEMVIHPRYALPRAREGDVRNAALCTDVYVLDPDRDLWRLFWNVVAARAAASEGRSVWR